MITKEEVSLITLKIEWINPETAKEYLSHNINNRPMSKRHVGNWFNSMERNDWMVTNDAICFDVNGRLINGQNRLQALIQANKELPFPVFRNLPSRAFAYMDCGKTRTGGDTLATQDVSNYNVISAAVSKKLALCKRVIIGDKGAKQDAKINNNDILLEYQQNKDFYDLLASDMLSIYKKTRLLNLSTATGITAYLTLEKKYDYVLVVDFFKMVYGVEPSTNNAVTLLNQRLVRDKSLNSKMESRFKHKLIIKAWNYYQSKKEVKYLQYNPDIESDIWFN